MTNEYAYDEKQRWRQVIYLGQTQIFESYDEFRQFYDEYLHTPHWRNFARQTKADRPQCEAEGCGMSDEESQHDSGQGLHVHHLHYATLGEETDEDVQVLCPHDHNITHGRPATMPILDPFSKL